MFDLPIYSGHRKSWFFPGHKKNDCVLDLLIKFLIALIVAEMVFAMVKGCTGGQTP